MSKVGLIQLTSTPDVDKNLTLVSSYFKQAKEKEVSLLVLPENFAYMGFANTPIQTLAEKAGEGKIQQTISQLAKYYGLWVVAGTIPIKAMQDKVRARSIVFDAEGEQAACYDKIHLFDVQVPGGEAHQESKTFEAGHAVVVIDTPVGRLGLSVCYDVRFAELYRQLFLKGAEIFTVPAAFTAVTGAAHWEVLLRSRAIENLCYVLAPNQGGHHENGRHTYGHTMAIDPWGKIIAEASEKPDLVIAEIELSYLKKVRQQFPCNEHHKMA